MQSFSTAYQDGKAASVTYTIPSSYSAPSGAPGAPYDVQPVVYGNEVQVSSDSWLCWLLAAAPALCWVLHQSGSARRNLSGRPPPPPLLPQLKWKESGAPYYVITAYDAYR